jgi:hypothetical protein
MVVPVSEYLGGFSHYLMVALIISAWAGFAASLFLFFKRTALPERVNRAGGVTLPAETRSLFHEVSATGLSFRRSE